jgi:hypothetical protein
MAAYESGVAGRENGKQSTHTFLRALCPRTPKRVPLKAEVIFARRHGPLAPLLPKFAPPKNPKKLLRAPGLRIRCAYLPPLFPLKTEFKLPMTKIFPTFGIHEQGNSFIFNRLRLVAPPRQCSYWFYACRPPLPANLPVPQYSTSHSALRPRRATTQAAGRRFHFPRLRSRHAPFAFFKTYTEA